MNCHELYMIMLTFIHSLIWVFAFIGGFYSYKYAVIIILIYLPLLYFVQSMSLHVLTKLKIEYVIKNKNFLKHKEMTYTSKDMCDFQVWSDKMNLSLEDVIDVMNYINYYADVAVLPNFILYTRKIFNNSWKNPFSAQGMIIFAYIINCMLISFKYNKI